MSFDVFSNAGVSSPAKAAYVVETVDAELRGASNGTRWAAFAIGSCVPLRVKHPEKKHVNCNVNLV